MPNNLGFSNMAYVDPGIDISDVSLDAPIDESGEIDASVRANDYSPLPPDKKPFPWWLLVIAGYIYYKEYNP